MARSSRTLLAAEPTLIATGLHTSAGTARAPRKETPLVFGERGGTRSGGTCATLGRATPLGAANRTQQARRIANSEVWQNGVPPQDADWDRKATCATYLSHMPTQAPLAMPDQSFRAPRVLQREAGAWVRAIPMLAFLALGSTASTWLLASLLAGGGWSLFDIVTLAMFPILVGWQLLALWESASGLLWQLMRSRSTALAPRASNWTGNEAGKGAAVSVPAAEAAPISLARLRQRTAILVPIYNEDVTRTFQGIEATLQSVASHPECQNCDLVILSDSQEPAILEAQWAAFLALEARAALPVYYRARAENQGYKSGNLRDFIQRHGGAYTYALVLDADSIMGGDALAGMLAEMDRRPKLGLLQSRIGFALGRSVFARAMQFSAHFSARSGALGRRLWFRQDGNFYGHNALFRVAAFAAHCGLPELSGRPPFGGVIKSHDLLEAALLRRAGYEVEIWSEACASYEETPPNLLELAKMEQRWCQGSVQISRVCVGSTLPWKNRVIIWLSALEYFVGPLALAFGLLGLVSRFLHIRFGIELTVVQETTLRDGLALLEHPATWLLAATAVLIFFGRATGWLLTLSEYTHQRAPARAYAQLLVSDLLEFLVSVFLFPVRATFHARFILNMFRGKPVTWAPASRASEKLTLAESLHACQAPVIVGGAIACLAAATDATMRWWMLPIALPLITAPLFIALTSRTELGEALRGIGLLRVPDEVIPPQVLTIYEELSASRPASDSLQPPRMPADMAHAHLTHAANGLTRLGQTATS